MILLLAIAAICTRVHGMEFVTCFGLGDFADVAPFDRMPMPHCPEELESDLHLDYFSNPLPNDADSVVGIDRTTIPQNWDNSRDTVFVIHGWTNDIDTGWLDGFKNAYLQNYDVNVVVVGWGGRKGAGDLNYQVAASTTRTIGAHVGEVINNLIVNGGGQANKFHVIGHSLGAHLSGHAGRWLVNNHTTLINRITGMDPAGPEFVSVDDRTIGLWTDCAAFVDSINTDNVYGSTPTNTGHANYYPHGGIEQPGCGITDNLCSHGRVINLYQESLYAQTCVFYARQVCSTATDLPGSCTLCGSPCGALGYPANIYPNEIYYLETNTDNPFCRG